MTGAVLELAAIGAQDKILIGNPQITFFVAIYKRHSNFAVNIEQQLFTGDFNFGSKCFCNISRRGDLINEMFLMVRLPDISILNKKNDKCLWVNSIGHALIKYIDVEIGGNIIDRHYGMWLNIWSELTITESKKKAFNKLIGKIDGQTNINYNNDKNLNLYIPQYFWFCRNLGSSLPIIALQNSELRINLGIRRLSELVITQSGRNLTESEINSLNIEQGSLYVKYIYLDDDERKFFAQEKHKYLIEQLQVNPIPINNIGRKNDSVIKVNDYEYVINFNLNHPVKEIIWVFQGSDVLSNIDDNENLISFGGNQWFNYSDSIFEINNNNYSGILEKAKILFEGRDRIEIRDEEFFRILQPYMYHSDVPFDKFIYLYSFSENPEIFQPMGSCNFSRIDTSSLFINLKKNGKNVKNPVMTLFATNYNTLYIEGGIAGVGFSN